MKNNYFKRGIISGLLLSLSLMSVMFLFYQLLDLPYIPYDIFDWMVQVLPGPFITFGIDTMIDLMLWAGIEVSNTAKIAEQFIAHFQFFLGASFAAILYYMFTGFRNLKADYWSGIIIAALFGLPLVVISAIISQSGVYVLLRSLWLICVIVSWGIALSDELNKVFRNNT